MDIYVLAVLLGATFNRNDRQNRIACTFTAGMPINICTNIGHGRLQTVSESIVSMFDSPIVTWWVPSELDPELARVAKPH